MFFERLLDWLVQGWAHIAPFVIIDAYQRGVVLRMGRYTRTMDVGFRWKWPLIEHVVEVTTCVTTMRLPPQSLTTKDGKSIVAAGIIKYCIEDPAPYVVGVWDQADVLADVAMGAVATAARSLDASELLSNPPEKEIATAIRRQVNRYGFKIEAFTFTDLGVVRSLRLMQPHGMQLGN